MTSAPEVPEGHEGPQDAAKSSATDGPSLAPASQRISASIGVALFLGALLVRLIGIGWGLKNDLHNQSYHPDELPIFSYSQRIEPAKGNFVPGFYNYGTLYLTVLRVTSDVVTSYTGGPQENNQDSYWAWVSRCHLGGRVVSAIAGAGTALIVFLMMRRFTTVLGATFAGLVIAIAPAHVVHSRFQTVDILATFFIAASAWAAVKLLPATETHDSSAPPQDQATAFGIKWAAWSGVFAGLSAGTKYSGAVAIIMLYTVLLIARRPRWFIEALAATAALIATFVITTPGCLLDQAQFIHDVQYEANHVATAHGIAFVDTGSGFIYHLNNLGIGIGDVLAAACFMSLVWALLKSQKWAWALLSFFLVYYVVIAAAEVKFIRYTFPLYIALAAAFGWAISYFTTLQRPGPGSRPWLPTAIGLVAMLGIRSDPGGFKGTVMLTSSMSGEDPRDSAARYIRSIATPATRVGFAKDSWYWSVPLEKDSALPPQVPIEQRLQKLKTETNPPVDFVLTSAGTPTVFSPDLVNSLKPELITYTSIEANDLLRLQGAQDLAPDVHADVDRTKSFFEALVSQYHKDRTFGGFTLPVEDMAYVCPQVWVWKINR